MDHNLDDSLNLESAIGSMDFDHSGVVVNQEDITLETTGHENDIQMEFEPIEEQPMLMDTGNEEIIVSDFMNDQFALQEYTTQDEGTTGACETVDVNQLNMLSQSESMIDLHFEPETLTQTVAHEVPLQPKYIQVKAAVALPRTIKKDFPATSTMPRQVPIAPKPPKLTISKPPFTTGKQFAIAPKPVTLVANKGASLVKKMSLAGVVQSGSKTGNSVLTQIGKQLVMLPAGSGQKIKLVSSGSGMSMQYVRANADQAQLISAKQITGTNVQKPLVGKFIVQAGQSNISSTDSSNQPAVITKLMSGVSTAPHTRYVMQQKTVPINIGGTKVLLTSPTKQGMKFKKQIISIQSPTPKLLPVTTQGAPTTKKVVITSNPSQNVILKAPPKTAQVGTKEGQRTQLHQISVPGKGIQYFRLITNPTPAAQKLQTPVSLPPKSFVLTDTKGNVIYMPGQSLVSDEPPPLVTTTGSTSAPKMTSRPQKKLIRIAPIAAKPALPVTQQSSRSSQSLLAPLSPIESTVEQIDHTKDLLEERVEIEDSGIVGQDEFTSSSDESRDTKASMRALLSEVEGGTVDHYQPQEQQDELRTHMHGDITMQEVEVEFERQQTPVEEDPNSMDALDSNHRSEDHPLIVIPSNYGKQAQIRVSSEGSRRMHEPKEYANIQVNIEEEPVPYLSPKQSHAPPSEPDLVPGDLSLRPRKACNCTKSQCLKLYCDCFANGEFCNRCNCNNCHNNLENEELRQKAIRACLDRNPNAFRPKIGKAKSGGPDIIRRHNKGCNCKRSGCLKNYCECYEAKIACTTMCKCVGCRNVEETLERRRDAMRLRDKLADPLFRPAPVGQVRQPCSFMTSEVIEAVCQCLIAAAVSGGDGEGEGEGDGDEESGTRGDVTDPIGDVIEEFARCLQDIISASHQSTSVGDEGQS